MRARKICIVLLLAFSIKMSAQSFFKVEFEAFSPPIKAMIDNVEGQPAKNFLMKDLSGKEIMLSHFLGRKVILWFWEKDEHSLDINALMKSLTIDHPNVVFLSMFNGRSNTLPENYFDYPFIILPNAAFLGEAVYDNELGSPRIYLVTEAGLVKMVLPHSYLSKMEDVKIILNNFILDKMY